MSTEEEIFETAAGLPEAERSAFLEKACAGQTELRDRIEALLRSNDVTGFMRDCCARSGPLSESGTTASGLAEQAGERIGRYRLLQQIGEGGFGVVWMAEQVEPVTRRVALKIIKAGMDTEEVIARFEAERQALAMMDHANIARVFDAGATDKGRPFFVMELVKGVPITKFCDERQFTTRRRLELFADVCSAINHAHQKGIIHRDIKPSNVLVTLHCDKPVIKVIDFGIAKAIEGRLTDKTLFTRFEQFVGTPAYMSPEQSALGGLDIDTRSDIYALGVLLYELLAGKPPFDTKTLLSAGYEEMRRIIREVEPQKPSARLITAGSEERTVLAKARQTTPERLSSLLQADLDWIVMKTIEKDRARRYETASSLAVDIQRFLSDEPVSAGPPSLGYRFQKFARRNKAALRAAVAVSVLLSVATALSHWHTAAIAGVLIAATAVSTSLAVWAVQAGGRARQKAEQEKLAREDAEAVSNYLTRIFESPDPFRDSRAITVSELLDGAAKRLENEFANHPGRRAKFHRSLGKTYYRLVLYPEAISQLEKARDFFNREAGPNHRDTLNTVRDLSMAYRQHGDIDRARKLLEEALVLYTNTLGPEDTDTLSARVYLAHIYDLIKGKELEALRLREETLRLRKKISPPEDPETLFAMHGLATSYHFSGRRTEALKLGEEVLALRKKVLGPTNFETLRSMANLVW